MHLIGSLLVCLVALEHIYFLYLEMFAWTSPRTLHAFGISLERAEDCKELAANQGLYNGFLAAGLSWSLFESSPAVALQLKVFFLGCVIAAALFGAFTVKRSLLLIQGMPAMAALGVALLTR